MSISKIISKDKKNKSQIRLHFYGGTRIVTGANYLLEIINPSTGLGSKILIDCGLFQGSREMERKNQEPFPYNPAEIDFLLITHAHLDHIGRIPKLIEDGFKGKIFATPPTIDLTKLILEDSQHLLEEKAGKSGAVSFSDHTEIEKIMSFFVAAEYDQKLELTKDIICFFREAGHILGSAIIEVRTRKKPRQAEFTTIVFSGDLGNPYISFNLLNKPTYIKQADYVVIESAYGGHNHPPEKIAKDLLEDIIEDVISRQGVLMIPTFALERAQLILYHLNELAEHKRIPYVPIYVDSPLAIYLTGVYQKHSQFLNKQARDLIESGEAIFKFPGLSYTVSTHESKMINRVPPPKIIIAGSGMSQGGRILHHEERYLPDPKSTLLFATYQGEGTLGRQIFDGAKEVKIAGQTILVQAQVKSISGYSAHADQAELLNWISRIKKPIKKIFVVQGEEKSVLSLKQMIMDSLGILAEAPQLNEIAEL